MTQSTVTSPKFEPTPEQPAPPLPPEQKLPDHNRLNLDYRQPMPRPNIRGIFIDGHTHLVAARHAAKWFEAGDHFGIHSYITMAPLEEAMGLQRDWGHRLHFITIPAWGQGNISIDDWLRRLEAFYNLGSRIIKFHMAPGTIERTKLRFDSKGIRRIMREAADRGMILMSHVGDPDVWYNGRYSDGAKWGTREEHYKLWEDALRDFRGHPWLGAHLGGNPENFPRLQRLLDAYPDLILDNSATRWMVREVSKRRDEAREFFIRNQDRMIFGTDQVSGDDRNFDFMASRIWCHRKLWETAYNGPSPILDPDFPPENQPMLHGLCLPDDVLQKLYHDNALKLLARAGATLGEGI
jgi:hypothetical protein